MSNVQDRINDAWNDLVFQTYEEWKEDAMDSDVHFQSLLDENEIEDYTEEHFSYDTFLESMENKALFNITTSGINPCINVPIREAMVVLNDRETWTSLKDTKVILLKDGFEYDSVDVAKCIYDKEPIFADGTCNADYIIEELSIPHLVEFYLANRY